VLNKATNITENIVTDIVDATLNEQEKKTKMFNWIIAITVAIIYLIVSLITLKWEITWVIWLSYCAYRVTTEYILKK